MKLSFFTLFAYLIYCHAIAQSPPPELARSYKNIIPFHQEIISGGYYLDPPREIEGHPYFKFRSFETGSITINGITYDEVPLVYNCYTDEVITFQPIHKQKILIRNDKINNFDFLPSNAYQFIRIAENPGYAHHKNGIYQLVEDGEAKLLVKHYKKTKPKREIGKFNSEFYENKDFFILKGDEFFPVKKQKQVFEALGLEKKALRQTLADRSIRYHLEPELFMKFLVQTHNSSDQ
jgi:hypothetical protein